MSHHRPQDFKIRMNAANPCKNAKRSVHSDSVLAATQSTFGPLDFNIFVVAYVGVHICFRRVGRAN